MTTSDLPLGSFVPPGAAVVGAGGMGKTVFLDDLAGRWFADRPVRRWAGHRLEGHLSLSGLREVLGRPEPGGIGAPAGEWSLLLDGLADEGAALLVDDAQWLDRESLAALVAVADRAAPAGVGVVVAHRPVRDRPDLAALDAVLSRLHPVVHLGPLPPAEVAKTARAVLGCAPDPQVLEALMARTEGVPLFVDRLLRGWRDAGVVERGRLGGDPAMLPPTVVRTVATEMEQLRPVARLVAGALAAGISLDDDLLGAVLGLAAGELRGAIGELAGAGLLSPARPALLPVVGEALEVLTPMLVQRDVHTRLAGVLAERGAPAGRVAEHLVAGGVRGPEAVAVLVRAADQALAEIPELAAEWYGEAVEAGADPSGLAARRAEAAARLGAVDDALRLADGLLSEPAAPDRARARELVAGALPARGLWARSAEAYEALGGDGADGPGTARAGLLAVAGLVATGEGDAAHRRFDAASADLLRPPPLETAAAELVARGLLTTLGPEPLGSLAYFTEAAGLLERAGTPALLPDTPHALGAVAALAAFDFAAAEHLLTRAIGSSAGGPAFTRRHRLLLGWVGLATGRWAMAEAALVDADGDGDGSGLGSDRSPRDALVAAALDVGLARRSGDFARLRAACGRADDAMRRHPVDLFSLPWWAELGVAAARLSEEAPSEPRWDEMDALLDRLGEPPLWTLPVRWFRLQAAIASGDKPAIDGGAKLLAEVPPATVALEGLGQAASAWTAVLSERIDRDEVDRAARALQRLGLVWEASVLTGGAAVRSQDAGLTRTLLERARELKAGMPVTEGGDVTAAGTLSQREREVARLVVAGLTHKEISAQLFISPKTVEHHVARIRQRVGATTRAELLAELRSCLAGGPSPSAGKES